MRSESLHQGGSEAGAAVDRGPAKARVFSDSLAIADNAAGGPAGVGGDASGPGPIVAPFGLSLECGDAILGDDEECDDGAGEASDACTNACQTRDEPSVPLADGAEAASRYLGSGRHPVSGLDDGFIATYVEPNGDEPVVGATLFNIWGQPSYRLSVSEGGSPIFEANPVAAALPNGEYAVGWSDFDGDGSDLGIRLRKVAASGELGSLQVANKATEFSQLDPDMIWTGSELVVAWVDYADAENGPDIRYRTFDANLGATSDDITLAGSRLPEAAIALAPFNGSWAAAYREGAVDGKENVVVRVGEESYRIGPVLGGPIDDRPALVELDATHLLVVFSAGTDPGLTGTANVPRIRYSVVDTESAALPSVVSLDPLDDVFTFDQQISHLSPAAERADNGVYVAWRSEARPGDGAGDQVWLKHLRWEPKGPGGLLAVHPDESEMLIPRTCDGSVGDQRTPALGRTLLPPAGALVIAWDDYSHSQGVHAGDPDVVVHYAPTHVTGNAAAPKELKETWSSPTGLPWPGRWTTEAVSPISAKVQYGEGEVNALAAPGTARGWVNDHTALNVDLVTTVRLTNDLQHAGVFARRADRDNPGPETYLAATFNSKKTDVWRIHALINGVQTDIKTIPLPKSFSNLGVGPGVDYRLRFRAESKLDGTLFLGMKVWRLGLTEPAAWLLQDTLASGHPVVAALGALPGRFGVIATSNSNNGGRVYFDDFKATYFEGNEVGSLDLPVDAVPLLLPRAKATYRRCTGNAPCAEAQGCCTGNADCATGYSCTDAQSEFLGLGSHASVCAVSHCSNLNADADEGRADCGGSDCAPCQCTSTLPLGAAGYCSVTCRCGIGDYPCGGHSGCLPGLVCGVDSGEPFGAAFGVDACVEPHCVNRVQDADETAIDCGGSCGELCSVCGPTNFAPGHCRPYCQCPSGHGNCYQDDECQAPLLCGIAKGPRFGFPVGTSACVQPHCLNNVIDTALLETGKDCGGPCGTCP